MAETSARRGGWLSLVVIVGLVAGGNALARHVADVRVGSSLRQAAGAGDIRMLSSVTCMYCGQARQWMTEHRVAFDECFIERDAGCQARYQLTGARGTPTLLVRGHAQLGFDKSRVLAVLARTP